MKKVSELTGAQLDYWVAKTAGANVVIHRGRPAFESEFDPEGPADDYDHTERWKMWLYFNPSGRWVDGGPIIEREKISVFERYDYWVATIRVAPSTRLYDVRGETPLIAAMRAYVASKYGEEVPDEVQL